MKNKGQKDFRSSFTPLLLKWNRDENTREMPWKGEKDSYRIWISEIILQQTRVEQGWEYYRRFIKSFPDVHTLSRASEKRIFKHWEGLGYYSRCRNLIEAAKQIVNEYEGEFPGTYEKIWALKGVGPYTAAAIASFAFNLPYAVLDGNVYRVLARVFGISKPIDSTEGKKFFATLAQQLIDTKQPGTYNQAIMDFGAIVCKPASPDCGNCVFNKNCYAYLNNKINTLPVKEKKISIRKRWFYFLVMERNKELAIRQRNGKDIWQQLYEFPIIETRRNTDTIKIMKEAEKTGWVIPDAYEIQSVSPVFNQQLTHQHISGRFIRARMKKTTGKDRSLVWITRKELKKYSFPGIINRWLKLEIGG